MIDVGRLAGVSHQTVSRVINRKGYVSEATRTAVEEAMTQLSYRPNRVARGLALRRTDSIGVINLGMPLNACMAQTHVGITTAAAGSGLSVTMANVAYQADVGQLTIAVEAALNAFMSRGADGLILSSPFSIDFAVVSRLAAEIPVVELTSDSVAGISSVSADGALGGRAAGEHLVALGHTGIAHVDGPADRADAQSRRRGFTEALDAAGLVVRARVVGDWSSASGYAAGLELRGRDDVTAIFCANDQMALGLIHAYAEIGKVAPRDFSVVGFDGIADSAHYVPPLTTVGQDFVRMGERAFAELARLMTGRRPRKVLLPPELVVRTSSAPPPRRPTAR